VNAALGESSDLLAFGAAVVGCVTLLIGLVANKPNLVRAGRVYTWVILAGAVLATVAMQHALITHDFRLSYVANNDSTQTPLLYRVTAMWSNLAGSILLWGLVLAGWIAATAIRFRRRATDPLVGWAMVICYGVAAFFFGLMLTGSNPFSLVKGAIPTDGPGPDPLLQNNVLVAFHPPLLYLGLVGFTVPFAFACASLITGRVGEGWLVEMRRWTLFSWGFLTFGLILGAWWSYKVLGWGGYWAWDPVENAAFVPWITATAYLHSVRVQEQRGMLRVWNLSLLVATFSLTILATFLTRSGVLASVHSFNNTGIGPALLVLFGVVVALSVGLLAWRGDMLRSPGSIGSAVSREAAFLVNNFAFGAFALVVLLGTVYPLVVQAVNGQQVTVGAPYFNTLTMPIVVCILFLMAVAPMLPWRRSSPGLLRRRLLGPALFAVSVLGVSVAAGVRGLNPLLAFSLGAFALATALRQLYVEVKGRGLVGFTGPAGGGMIVHVGVVLIAVGFAASHSFAASRQLTLSPGQTASFQGHTFRYLGPANVATPTHTGLEAVVIMDSTVRLTPAVSDYPFAQEAVGTPSVHSTLTEDVYLTLASTPVKPTSAAVIGVIVEPLVSWIWIGGGVMALGTALSAWPRRRRRSGVQPGMADRSAGEGVSAPSDEQPLVGAPVAFRGMGAAGAAQ